MSWQKLRYVSFIPFLVFGFWQRSYDNMKILRNLCLHFERQDGQDGKKWKGNHANQKMEIWDKRNLRLSKTVIF